METANRERNYEIAMELRRAVTKLARHLRGIRQQGALSTNKVAVLGYLYRDGPSSPSEIAEGEYQQPQSFTRVFAELERRKMISRSPHPDDRRQILLSLTEYGKQMLIEDMQQRDQWLAEALSEMSEIEVEVLRLAARIISRIAIERGKNNGA